MRLSYTATDIRSEIRKNHGAKLLHKFLCYIIEFMRKLLVVPVYNEIATARRVMEAIRANHDGDILAVDDGSTDGSSEALASFPWIHVIRHAANCGYGAAVITGLEYARKNAYDSVVTMDCDEQHEPGIIPRMFTEQADVDVLSGSRYLTGSADGDMPPVDRMAINKTITAVVNSITGYTLTDSFCGFKRYRVCALASLLLDEPGYGLPLQFWIQARHFGLSVAEIAIPRIYKNLDRSFGEGLDDPENRLAYYRSVIERELKKWPIS
jgi:dolichol-phosphate mannosyltransferase